MNNHQFRDSAPSVFSLEIGGPDVVLPVQILRLKDEISLAEGRSMVAGDWVVLNTLPWLEGRMGGNSFKKVLGQYLVSGRSIYNVKVRKLKENSLFLENICKRPTLSFCERVCLKDLVHNKRFIRYMKEKYNPVDIQTIKQSLILHSTSGITAEESLNLPEGISAHSFANVQPPAESTLGVNKKVTGFKSGKKRKLTSRKELEANVKRTKDELYGKNDDASFAIKLRFLSEHDDATSSAVADAALNSKQVKGVVVDAVTSTLAEAMPIPVGEALQLKDKQHVSDEAYRLGAGGGRKKKTLTTDNFLNPRLHDVVKQRNHIDDFAVKRFGIIEMLDTDEIVEPDEDGDSVQFARAYLSIKEVAKALICASIAAGVIPPSPAKFKLTVGS